MARASAGTRIAVVCAVFSASLLAAGPVQADVGDLVDHATGGAVGDTVPDGVQGTVDRVTRSADAVLEDTVRKVAKPAAPSPQQDSSSARGDDTGTSATTAEAQPDAPRAGSSRPKNGSVRPAPPQREQAYGGVPVLTRTSTHGDSMRRLPVAEHVARQTGAARAPYADRPCESGSLAARDLRRCARAGTPLPGLGGVAGILPLGGLLMIGIGLVLVAWGRRRGTSAAPATC